MIKCECTHNLLWGPFVFRGICDQKIFLLRKEKNRKYGNSLLKEDLSNYFPVTPPFCISNQQCMKASVPSHPQERLLFSVLFDYSHSSAGGLLNSWNQGQGVWEYSPWTGKSHMAPKRDAWFLWDSGKRVWPQTT